MEGQIAIEFIPNATAHYTYGKKSEEMRCRVLKGQYDTTILMENEEKFIGNWDTTNGCLKLSNGKGEWLWLIPDPTMMSNWIGRWEDTDTWGMVCIEFDNSQY